MKFKDLQKGEKFSWKWENACSISKYTKTSQRSATTEDGKKFNTTAYRTVVRRQG